jgi:ribosomal protein S18 acetylase RimI-like enzyme
MRRRKFLNKISYIEDKNLYAYCNEIRNFDIINKQIESKRENLDYYIEIEDSIYGYEIKDIEPLSNIYGFNFFAVNFLFKNISHSFNEKEDVVIKKLILNLHQQIEKKQGYYIIKIPSFNNMLINQINLLDKKLLFAGGTVCYYITDLKERHYEQDGLLIKLATKADKIKYHDELIDLSEASFKNFFGQYHISYVTRHKAHLIYKNWAKKYVENYDENNLFIAYQGEKVVGFIAFDKTEYSYEIVLNCVDENYRGLKIYERMLNKCVNYCLIDRKLITVSTQIDNIFPQRAWINNGFKPYNTFYLFHYNNLR